MGRRGQFPEIWELKEQVPNRPVSIQEQAERNERLEADVAELSKDDAAIEDHARSELGMIKRNETYYQVILREDERAPPLLVDLTKRRAHMSNKYGHSAVWVVIPAAGVGKRMHSDCPKRYLQLRDKTILEHTLDCFLGHPAIRGIVVVVSAEDGYWPLLEKRLQGFPVYRASGGRERADSVLNGLDFLATLPGVTAVDVVLVHDAARPLSAPSGFEPAAGGSHPGLCAVRCPAGLSGARYHETQPARRYSGTGGAD
ncbi:MAG: 2-C-methyl-D-erythritol 4-phosphate cytidylyltransferase [Thiolinea sp.]